MHAIALTARLYTSMKCRNKKKMIVEWELEENETIIFISLVIYDEKRKKYNDRVVCDRDENNSRIELEIPRKITNGSRKTGKHSRSAYRLIWSQWDRVTFEIYRTRKIIRLYFIYVRIIRFF